MEGITGVVLAGGLGRRMGGVDKGLQPLRGKPMIAAVLERLAPQVSEILINANQNLEAYARFGHRVVPDAIGGFAGPLAGLHACLGEARHELVLTVPCDSPFLPFDLLSRLRKHLGENDLAIAKTFEQVHPVFSLVRTSVLNHLSEFLSSGGRKIDLWYSTLKFIEVPFDDEAEAFHNINTREELDRA
ncbi:MAG: molybdenum cofactor guanylyltransferase MobA [Pseudomonadota bacterium]